MNKQADPFIRNVRVHTEGENEREITFTKVIYGYPLDFFANTSIDWPNQ